MAWLDAGPSNTTRGAAFAVMSGGEQRMVRLVATPCRRPRVPWSVGDIGFDERGAAVLEDWLRLSMVSFRPGSIPASAFMPRTLLIA